MSESNETHIYKSILRPFSHKNICLWFDGTIRPAKGHNGYCTWTFDGQIWKHHHGTILDIPFSSNSIVREEV